MNANRQCLLVLLMFLLAWITGCADATGGAGGSAETISPDPVSATTLPSPSPSTFQDDRPAPSSSDDYSMMVAGTKVSLRDWDDRVSFHELIGPPEEERITKLENADTFTGSFRKEMDYPGLSVQLFSPKENGQTYWIMQMTTTSGDYETARGLRVGMDLEELKSVYPDIQQVPDGRTDPLNCAYGIEDSDRYLNAHYEVTDGLISEIHLFAELP